MAGAVERPFLAGALSSAGGRVITAPFQFVTEGSEFLRVTTVNSQTSARIKVFARIVRSDGSIDANGWDHIPNSDRSVKSDDYALGIGALVTLTIMATNAAPLVGQTFVTVSLVRGVGAAAITLGTLLGGYVTSTQALGWPGSPIETSISGGGYIRTIIGTNPPAGAVISETVPTGARWELLAVWARLFTSAVVSNRFAVLSLFNSGNQIIESAQPNAQTASAQGQYSWGQGFNAQLLTGSLIFQAPLAMTLPLLAGENFQISLIGGDVGDDWDAPHYQVREWLEVA